MSDPYDALLHRVRYPESWKPQPGDTLVGEVVGWETVTLRKAGEEPRDVDVLTLRDADNVEHAVWCFHQVLKADLVGKCSPGDLVAISYVGKVAKASGEGSFAKYRVAVEAASAKSPLDGAGEIPC